MARPAAQAEGAGANVQVLGAGAFTDVAVRAAARGLREKVDADEAEATAANRIVVTLLDLGFPDVHVDSGRTGKAVRFTVRLGPRLHFGNVTFDASIDAPAPNLGHGWFSRAALMDALAPVRRQYEEEGYPLVEFSPSLTEHDGSVDVAITAERGDHVEIEKAVVVDEDGNRLKNDLPSFGLESGMPYKRSSIEAALAALRRAHPGCSVVLERNFATRIPPPLPPSPTGRVLERIDSGDEPFRANLVFVVTRTSRRRAPDL